MNENLGHWKSRACTPYWYFEVHLKLGNLRDIVGIKKYLTVYPAQRRPAVPCRFAAPRKIGCIHCHVLEQPSLSAVFSLFCPTLRLIILARRISYS